MAERPEGPEGPEEAADASPPPYTENSSLPHQVQQQPMPATGENFYHALAALLLIKCFNVPRLMREGLYWDDENVVREEGYLDKDFTNSYRNNGKNWSGTRHYFLKDLRKPPLWTATIKVFALSNETLHRFDLNQLSPDNMQYARATNLSRQNIYYWEYGSPEKCFNAIYDDLPMEGWWPWPKGNQ
ncbi:hypothetical protein F4801DRAFT_603827 [Xylaria longipes]|nr:hypothetical protein F4801DRAFT_603827 [Xylaria longipes]